MNIRSIATTITALAAAAALTACGSGSTAGEASPSVTAGTGAPPAAQAHNQADVTFVQQMIPHHSQAVEMSKLAPAHAESPQVKALAARIQGAQQPEIDQMNGFLKAWNVPMPAPGGAPMSGMNHGDMPGTGGSGGAGQANHGGMPGMMTDSQMSGLEQAHGAAFDTMFLRMMIAHHQGAVTMSGTELRDGRSTDAEALAQRIIDAQRREITEMQGLAAK